MYVNPYFPERFLCTNYVNHDILVLVAKKGWQGSHYFQIRGRSDFG